MSLYLKYRPTELAEVKGNTIVVKSLEGMLGDPATCPHSFFFMDRLVVVRPHLEEL